MPDSTDAHVRTDLSADEHRALLAEAVEYHKTRAARLKGDSREAEARQVADEAQSDLDTWDKEHN